MRIFHVCGEQFEELQALPEALPAVGYLWVASARGEFEVQLAEVQAALQRWTGGALVDLHVSDLLNHQLPSRFDYTSWYDLLVFRRLAAGAGTERLFIDEQQGTLASARAALAAIDTSPVGFAVFDRVLLTVHPTDCVVRDYFAQRLQSQVAGDGRGSARMPTSPADLMLRIVNQMVDGYLELRRELTRQLDHWQAELLHPKGRFNNWGSLLDARNSLHHLDEICEDQRSAIQDWIESLATWDANEHSGGQAGLEMLMVRSRDVLEHIERVVHHVRRLEQNAETAVQMHFSVQSNRTNDIMRTLTVLTAIFLPLNLIAGIFGMNFEFIPLLHRESGFWWAMGTMALTAVLLGVLFWRKRYLARTAR